MKRWGLAIALLLSLGVNVGVLLTLAVGGWGNDAEVDATLPEELDDPAERVERPWERGAGPPREMTRFVDRLGLEGEERERFVELQREFLRTAFESRRRRMEIQRELRRELISPEPDRDAAERLVREMAETQRAVETQLVHTVLESRALLSEEQERHYLRFMGRLQGRLSRGGEGRRERGPRDRRGPG